MPTATGRSRARTGVALALALAFAPGATAQIPDNIPDGLIDGSDLVNGSGLGTATPTPSASPQATPSPTPTPTPSPSPSPSPTPTPSPSPSGDDSSSSDSEEEDERPADRASVQAEIEAERGKPPVYVAIDIFNLEADPWPPILLQLSEGYNDCFGRLYTDSFTEFGHRAPEGGTQVVGQPRRFDRPEPELVSCIDQYYRDNTVAGPDGRPIKVAFDPGTAAALTEQAAAERETLVDAIVRERGGDPDGGGGGSGGGSGGDGSGGDGSGGDGSGGDGPGGSGPGGSGPGGSGPGGDGPEDVPDLPEGDGVAITDLDAQSPPEAKDTFALGSGNKVKLTVTGLNQDLAQMEVTIRLGRGAEDLVIPGSALTVVNENQVEFAVPGDAVAGTGLELVVTNKDLEGQAVTSPPSSITLKPTDLRVESDPEGDLGGEGAVLPGKPLRILGEGFAADLALHAVSIGGNEATVTAVAAGDPDTLTADAPADVGPTGQDVEVKVTVRPGTPQAIEVIVDPPPKSGTPSKDPAIRSVEDGGGSPLEQLVMGQDGKVNAVFVGRNFGSDAAKIQVSWNGTTLPATHAVVQAPTAEGTKVSVRFDASLREPILRAGNTKIAFTIQTDEGEKTTPDFDVKVVPHIRDLTTSGFGSGIVKEGLDFALDGFGFGNGSGDVTLSIGDASNVPAQKYETVSGVHRLTYTMTDLSGFACDGSSCPRRENLRGTLQIGGVSFKFGDPSSFGDPLPADTITTAGVGPMTNWVILEAGN